MNNNTVLYVRSTNNSKHSLELQKSNGRNYAKHNSLKLNIIVDTNTSGVKPLNERSGSSALLHLVENGLVNTIIVESLSRISRNFVVTSEFISFIDQHNVNLIILEGGDQCGK
ncbi:recombinase family protein [Halobacillus salinarum]|uniref:Recombinase family protein n=1 Tax=Halobacillus salinarum TaxID=2932257 RepID=A0ABY4EJ02_9BACI|nr:recombinase family protein [Halobacillus salinarum]UOQ44071.1 recombinase family protein [Halobacillus salinarum]